MTPTSQRQSRTRRGSSEHTGKLTGLLTTAAAVSAISALLYG